MNNPDHSDPQSPTDSQLDSSKAHSGRHPALGAEERKEIVELSKRGCSRRSIARRIGCSAQTITRTADRDPDFARQLACAETDLELTFLDSITAAAQSGRYWRAAAWSLERRFPDLFPRSPDVITVQQIATLIANIAQIIEEEIPAPTLRKNVLKRLDSMTSSLRNEHASPAP